MKPQLITRKSAWGLALGLAALAVLHAALVPRHDLPLPDGVLTIHQAHRVQGEDYLLRVRAPQAVLVGSSLSETLPQVALGPVHNLALSGGSAHSGLAIIAESSTLPALVLIEANVLDRPADDALLDDLFSPLARLVKAACAVCLSRNQPLTLLLAHLSWARLKPLSPEEADRRAQAATPEPTNPATFAVQLEGARLRPDAKHLGQQLGLLRQRVQALQARGVRVAFVELPQDAQIEGGVRHQAMMSAVRAGFPDSQYQWLHWPGGAVRTRDGAHLIYLDGHRMARHIRTTLGLGAPAA